LRRRPKQLSDEPLLYRPVGRRDVDVHGTVVSGGEGRAGGGQLVPTARWMATDEAGARRTLDELDDAVDPGDGVSEMCDAIARRLSLRPRSRDLLTVTGSGRLVSRPYRFGSDDIDLDRTLEALTEHPVPEDTDIIVRERMRSSRAVALVVDLSGSMRGERARVAAATVGALAGVLVDDELAVIAFWQDAVLVKSIAQREPASVIVDRLLRIPTKGLTNIHFALTVGLGELAECRSRFRQGILLSDAVHNAGPDPRLVAARYARLDVLLQTDDEHDAMLGTDLARIGHGEAVPVHHHRDVAHALNRLLAT
jgi:Mg-chelatase subunit ChlD